MNREKAAKSRQRYEKKFTVPSVLVPSATAVLRAHPALFSEMYEQRVIQNVYFDTLDLRLYRAHVEGADRREKIRLRWYGDESVVQPVLEVKAREGDVGFKESSVLPQVLRRELLDSSTVRRWLRRCEASAMCGRDIEALRPVLHNWYTRSYWVSTDTLFRVTVDRDLYFARLGHGSVGRVRDDGAVVELKYGRNHHGAAHLITQHFPWRQERFSKYVRGVEHARVAAA